MPTLTLFRGLLVLPALGLGVMLCGCNKPAAGGMPPGGFPASVTTITAQSADVPVYLDEIGKATASQSVTVVPQVSGIILKRDFQDGEDLKKDQLLFEIDPRPFQYQLDQANGQLKKDIATRDSAAWNVQQDNAAMASHSISEQQLHNDTATRDAAEGSIAVDKAAIETANLNLEYCRITSPINGRAGARLVDSGNVVTAAGQAPGTNLLSIQTIDPIYADFTITEAELLRVQQYMRDNPGKLKVQVQLPQDAVVMAGPPPASQPTAAPGAEYTPEEQHPAVVGIPAPPAQMAKDAPPSTRPALVEIPRLGDLTFLDNAVQDGAGTVKLRATLPNADHHFWPGQFLNVRLVLATQKNAVLIPSAAAQIGQKGPYVYVVKPDNTAALTPITLGQRQGDMVVVETGLNPGDQVVTAGFVMIMDKGKVNVMNGPPGGAPAAHAGAPTAWAHDASGKNESNGGSL